VLGKQAGPLPDRQLAGHKGRAARRGMSIGRRSGVVRLAAGATVDWPPALGNAWQTAAEAAGFWTAA